MTERIDHIIREIRVQQQIFANYEPTADLLEFNNRNSNAKAVALVDKIAELEAAIRRYLKNADTRMIMGFDFDKGEYPVTSETISILCEEKQALKSKVAELEAFKATTQAFADTLLSVPDVPTNTHSVANAITTMVDALLEKEPCKHVFRNVTGQPWLKCMECGEVVDE